MAGKVAPGSGQVMVYQVSAMVIILRLASPYSNWPWWQRMAWAGTKYYTWPSHCKNSKVRLEIGKFGQADKNPKTPSLIYRLSRTRVLAYTLESVILEDDRMICGAYPLKI